MPGGERHGKRRAKFGGLWGFSRGFAGSRLDDFKSFFGSPREFVTGGILRGFPEFLKSDILGVGHGHALCFQ